MTVKIKKILSDEQLSTILLEAQTSEQKSLLNSSLDYEIGNTLLHLANSISEQTLNFMGSLKQKHTRSDVFKLSHIVKSFDFSEQPKFVFVIQLKPFQENNTAHPVFLVNSDNRLSISMILEEGDGYFHNLQNPHVLLPFDCAENDVSVRLYLFYG
jgi:hypothetical protein